MRVDKSSDHLHLPHLFVHVDCCLVRHSNEEIHEPSILLFACLIQAVGQGFGEAHLPVLGRDSKTSDMTVPGQIFVAQDFQIVWIFLYFAHDWDALSERRRPLTCMTQSLTITDDLAQLILSHDEHGRPFANVVTVECMGIIFRERV